MNSSFTNSLKNFFSQTLQLFHEPGPLLWILSMRSLKSTRLLKSEPHSSQTRLLGGVECVKGTGLDSFIVLSPTWCKETEIIDSKSSNSRFKLPSHEETSTSDMCRKYSFKYAF